MTLTMEPSISLTSDLIALIVGGEMLGSAFRVWFRNEPDDQDLREISLLERVRDCTSPRDSCLTASCWRYRHPNLPRDRQISRQEGRKRRAASAATLNEARLTVSADLHRNLTRDRLRV